ncbi:MAG TPA: hypothetical protein VHM23_13370 [Actinomycetota bacterium]|jgi:hypothetical protein|nr:hypothetical protein [Actinomycetota bacterium]
MPAIPDRDTLRLRRPDRRPPAEAVALARRELARRPAPTLADVRLAPPDRALVSFQGRYPGVAERFHPSVLWAVAHAPEGGWRNVGRCPDAWCLVLAYAKHRGLPAPRVDQLGRLLLGEPGPSCRVALGWQPPKPKPKPKQARSRARPRMPAASSTAGRTLRVPPPDALVAATGAGLRPTDPPPVAPDTPYNRAAVARI